MQQSLIELEAEKILAVFIIFNNFYFKNYLCILRFWLSSWKKLWGPFPEAYGWLRYDLMGGGPTPWALPLNLPSYDKYKINKLITNCVDIKLRTKISDYQINMYLKNSWIRTRINQSSLCISYRSFLYFFSFNFSLHFLYPSSLHSIEDKRGNNPKMSLRGMQTQITRKDTTHSILLYSMCS